MHARRFLSPPRAVATQETDEDCDDCTADRGRGLAATGAAKAADIFTTSEYTNPDLVQQVPLVCDDAGRCWRTHNGARVIVRDSYNYLPRERYYERRTYRDWDERRAGVGIRTPGVSVGVDVGEDRW